MFRSTVLRWAYALPLSGPLAIMLAIAAIAVPTTVRNAVTGTVTGCEFTPYLPFVLTSAILLRWSVAAVVAFGSVAILGGLIFGPQSATLGLPCFASSASMFLGASAIMIRIAELLRRTEADPLQPRGRMLGAIFVAHHFFVKNEPESRAQMMKVIKWLPGLQAGEA